MKTSLNNLFNLTIELCNELYNVAIENNYLNTQDLINWQDKLNEISIR